MVHLCAIWNCFRCLYFEKVSKQVKPFAFARFNKVTDVDQLINQRSVWLGNFHLYANVAHFNRDTKPSPSLNSTPNVPLNASKPSFANVVKDKGTQANHEVPVMVLEPVPDSFQSNDYEDVHREKNDLEQNHVENAPRQVNFPSNEPFGLEDLILISLKKTAKGMQEKPDSDPKYPSGFTPLNSFHSQNVTEKVAHEQSGVHEVEESINNMGEAGVIEQEHTNVSFGGSKQDHFDSMTRPRKPINGFVS
nr:RNA-directed DNA polymerase, eukaryota, nucleotide-binding alpha-beta plait domain protein [Tanacetum cinerariifolium]